MFSIGELANTVARARTPVGVRPDEADILLLRSRLKFWTITGVMSAIRGRGEGKGRRRYYHPDAVNLAIILSALADAGVHASRFAEVVRSIQHDPLWKKAVQGRGSVLLTVMLAKGETIVTLRTATGLASAHSPVAPTLSLSLSDLFSRAILSEEKKRDIEKCRL